MGKFRFERSSGGLVMQSGKILMVEVENLRGDIVWTFPKGHLEAGETPEQAALREVLEETGWDCRILAVANGAEGPFETVQYFFTHEGVTIKKEVIWYLMEAVAQTGSSDPKEIRKVAWFAMEEALARSSYPSDKKLLSKLTGRPEPANPARARRAPGRSAAGGAKPKASSRRQPRSSGRRSSATPRSRGR